MVIMLSPTLVRSRHPRRGAFDFDSSSSSTRASKFTSGRDPTAHADADARIPRRARVDELDANERARRVRPLVLEGGRRRRRRRREFATGALDQREANTVRRRVKPCRGAIPTPTARTRPNTAPLSSVRRGASVDRVWSVRRTGTPTRESVPSGATRTRQYSRIHPWASSPEISRIGSTCRRRRRVTATRFRRGAWRALTRTRMRLGRRSGTRSARRLW